MLSASASDEFANWHKDGAHGLLTYYFLKGLHKGNADSDKNGQLSYAELHNYVHQQVSDFATLKLNNRSQHPQLGGGGKKERVFINYQN